MTAPPSLDFQVDERPGAVIVRCPSSTLRGDPEAERLGRQLEGLLRKRLAYIVLDLQELPCLNSALIGKLVFFQRAARRAGGDLVLCNLTSSIGEKVLE